jgi:CPA2 family monovalent cation:H+ antiporter-2
MLVIATPQTLEVRQMIEAARLLNPNIEVAVRSHNEQEALLLEREGAGKVFVGESELARSMTSFVLARVAAGGLNEKRPEITKRRARLERKKAD